MDINPTLLNMLGVSRQKAQEGFNVTGFYQNSQDRDQLLSIIERDGIADGFETQLRIANGHNSLG